MITERSQIQPAKRLAQAFVRSASWLDEHIEAKAQGDTHAARALEEQWEITITSIVSLHEELGKLIDKWQILEETQPTKALKDEE